MSNETERTSTVGILEDDLNWSETLKNAINAHEKFSVSFTTASSTDAYRLVKAHQPDFLISDLQMSEEGSEGDGIELLYKLHKEKDTLKVSPIKIVQTDVQSAETKKLLNSGIADYTFIKRVFQYNPEAIIAYMLRMLPFLPRNQQSAPPKVTPHEKGELTRARVIAELDQYFMKRTVNGYLPLIDSVIEVINLPKGVKPEFTHKIYPTVGKKHGMTVDNVNVSMHRLVQVAFTKTSTEDLGRLYKPYLDIGGCPPRLSEFIAYTAEKIKQENIE